jgi:hypothetical protein
MHLWSNCSHTKTKVEVMNACGNTQLCAGLRSGIKANLPAVRAIWPQSAGWTNELEDEEDDGDPQSGEALWRGVRADGMADPAVDPGASEDDGYSH